MKRSSSEEHDQRVVEGRLFLPFLPLFSEDTVGSPLETSLQVLKPGGILVALSGQPPIEQAKERGVQVVATHTHIGSDILENLAGLIDAGDLRTVIKGTFPLSEASQAHELGQQGHGRGRIVLHVA